MIFQMRMWIRRLTLGGLLPALLFLLTVYLLTQPADPPPDATDPTPAPTLQAQQQFLLQLKQGSTTRLVELEDYLVGVVLAEMPAGFAPEALRAQAVAARTYTVKHCLSARHGRNTLCGDHACCQAYIDPEQYVRQGGSTGSVDRVRQAVEDTAGLVLTYDSALIDATYFSCAGGQTEDAAAVWGQDVPYLQSVPSLGEEQATYFMDSKTFTAEEFQQALAIRLTGPVSSWFTDVTFTDGGGVDRISIGGVAYRGTTIRTLLGLRSTAFSVSYTADTVTFHTRGYGHRVGLSQYGANAMALQGSDYAQILTHYYCGVEIVQYWEKFV